MITIDVVLKNPQVIVDVLDRVGHAVVRLDPGHVDQIGDAVRNAYKIVFDTEGQPSGGWRPLSKRTTVPERISLGFPGEHPILRRTGSLMSSFVDRGNALHRQQSGSFMGMTVITVGSGDPRASVLSHGDPTRAIPERPIEFFDDRMIADIGAVVETVVVKAAGI